MYYALSKLSKARVLRRVAVERLAEPLHLNIAAVGVAAFGSFRSKVAFDLALRPHYAFGLLQAADLAKRYGISAITAVEFGVATGAGLMMLSKLGERVTQATGVRVEVVGFDTGRGMPPARDWRDHPDIYQGGDFAMNEDALRAALPPRTRLVIGELQDTVPTFMGDLAGDAPLGFASIDVDYYYSAVDALALLGGKPTQYLPLTVLYFDDVALMEHNSAAGQLLAIREFNDTHAERRIEQWHYLRNSRVFQRPGWISQMHLLHVMDHPQRSDVDRKAEAPRHMTNPYIGRAAGKERFS